MGSAAVLARSPSLNIAASKDPPLEVTLGRSDNGGTSLAGAR